MNTALRRSLPLLLAATALPSLTHAEPLAQIYGQIHVSVDHLNSDVEVDSSEFNTSSNNSRLGLRGKHKLDERLTLTWQAEATADFVNGGALSLNRDTFVGLAGDWGLARLGQFDTPYKRLWNRVELFANQAGDARNVIGFDGLDRRFKNGVHYRTPDISGFTFDLHYSTNTENNAAQDSDSQAVSTSVQYENNSFWAAISYDDEANELTSFRVAGLYDFACVRITALYQETDRDDPSGFDTKAYGAGLRYTLNDKWSLKTQYYKLEVEDANKSNAQLVAAGMDYQYASSLLLYANYASLDNEGTFRTAYNVGRTGTTSTSSTVDRPLTGSEVPTALSLGLVYKF